MKHHLPAVMLCLLAAPLASGAEPVPDERIAAYQQFRASFDTGRYTEALPLATRVVELTRNQFGAEAQELVNPLTNLGTTYHRLQRDDLAADNYREALKLLDLDGNSTNDKLVRPLQGLGVALQAAGREADAIAPLKRALEITRNREGLFAVSQLPLLKNLINCYTVAHRIEDAGREQQYAYTVAESVYGKNDIRMLPELDDYARWNESVGRYSAARLLHARAVQIANSKDPLLAINGLRGIARSYRLAFVMGEKEETVVETLPRSLSDNALPVPVTGPSSEGERALREAARLLTSSKTLLPLQLGTVQTDLGDWYLTAGADLRAFQTYRDAWNSLASVSGEAPLRAPVALTYKPPNMAVTRGTEDPDLFDEQDIELRLSINKAGAVRDAVVVNPAPQREAAERAVISALKRAQFRPGFENGEPVVTTDVMHHEKVYVRRPKSG
jgi:tetratricopeptide (TPR) repeat protein